MVSIYSKCCTTRINCLPNLLPLPEVGLTDCSRLIVSQPISLFVEVVLSILPVVDGADKFFHSLPLYQRISPF